MEPAHDVVDVTALARQLRENPALRAKAAIGLVSDVLGGGDWLGGPGDDGALIPVDADNPAGTGMVACGEALLPAFVAADPRGAGLAAVVTNVNDLAAMGAQPRAIVDTVAAEEAVAREVLAGLREGSSLYDVPLVGGHLTIHHGAPALSAFGLGVTGRALSVTRAAAGQQLLVACCTEGTMNPSFPFFASFDQRGRRLAGDVRVLHEVAQSGACVAAKDVSMAGLVGSLAMLVERNRLGVTVDLDAVPRPDGVSLPAWLTCFPAFAFLLCAAPGRADVLAGAFAARGLDVAVIGQLDDSGILAVRQGGRRATVLDLSTDVVTGLSR